MATDSCYAAQREPEKEWAAGQRTPFCNSCESDNHVCNYCRAEIQAFAARTKKAQKHKEGREARRAKKQPKASPLVTRVPPEKVALLAERFASKSESASKSASSSPMYPSPGALVPSLAKIEEKVETAAKSDSPVVDGTVDLTVMD